MIPMRATVARIQTRRDDRTSDDAGKSGINKPRRFVIPPFSPYRGERFAHSNRKPSFGAERHNPVFALSAIT